VPRILELVELQLGLRHGVVGVNPFQRLDTGLLVRADQMHALLMEFLSLMVQRADRPDLPSEERLVLHFMVQPIFDPVRF
jgi:hypothetical protein